MQLLISILPILISLLLAKHNYNLIF